MMAMREIWCSDEGDQGLNEGDFSKLQKGVFKQLIKVFNPLQYGGLFYKQWYNKYGIVHFLLKVVLTGKIYIKWCIFLPEYC